MKKYKNTSVKYYAILLSGIIIFLPFVFFDSLFPGSVEKYKIFFIIWLILAFFGYIYLITKYLKTKEFLEFEKYSSKKEDEFFEKNMKKLKTILKIFITICIVVDIPITILLIYFLLNYVLLRKEHVAVLIPYIIFGVLFNIFVYCFKSIIERNKRE